MTEAVQFCFYEHADLPVLKLLLATRTTVPQ